MKYSAKKIVASRFPRRFTPLRAADVSRRHLVRFSPPDFGTIAGCQHACRKILSSPLDSTTHRTSICRRVSLRLRPGFIAASQMLTRRIAPMPERIAASNDDAAFAIAIICASVVNVGRPMGGLSRNGQSDACACCQVARQYSGNRLLLAPPPPEKIEQLLPATVMASKYVGDAPDG